MEWNERIKLYLNGIGLRCIIRGNKNDPEKIIFQRNVDIFHQKAFGDITSNSSKMRTYGILQSEVGEEPYLRIVRNVKDRISMTKFRLSNHTLVIEGDIKI